MTGAPGAPGAPFPCPQNTYHCTMHHAFRSLKRAGHRDKALGKAPHKPVLLLAVIEQVEVGKIIENKIYITAELIATFQKLWSRLVPEQGWQPRFFLPFFHLTGDKFWQLELVPGAQVALTNSYSPKSIAALKDSIAYASFAPTLWKQLCNETDRAALRQLLLNTYFPDRAYGRHELQRETRAYLEQLELDFLNNLGAEPNDPTYRLVEYEARSTLFKTEVPKLYGYTCAISGLRLTAFTDVQMVDACHIVPWSQSKNDSVQNGISLTPTLHRAFDRHLISIDEDYRVILSRNITEAEGAAWGFKQFEGKKILLPDNPKWWPGQEELGWHRGEMV